MKKAEKKIGKVMAEYKSGTPTKADFKLAAKTAKKVKK